MTWQEDLLNYVASGITSTLLGQNTLGLLIEMGTENSFVQHAGNFLIGIKDLVVSLYSLLGDFSSIIQIIEFLPESWMSIILLCVGTVVVLRVYSFVKDIEILGNKL